MATPIFPQSIHNQYGRMQSFAANNMSAEKKNTAGKITVLILPIILCCVCILSSVSCYMGRERLCKSSINQKLYGWAHKLSDFKYSIASLSCISGLCTGGITSIFAIPLLIC